MLNERDTLYRPFITSDSLFTHLLQKRTQYPVKLLGNSNTLPNWDIHYSNQEALLYKALLQDSDNGVA